MGKRVLPAVYPAFSSAGLKACPAHHFLLYLHEKLTGNAPMYFSFPML